MAYDYSSRVVAASTQQGLEGANVTLLDGNDSPIIVNGSVMTFPTLTGGNIAFTNTDAASLRVRVSHVGYVTRILTIYPGDSSVALEMLTVNGPEVTITAAGSAAVATSKSIWQKIKANWKPIAAVVVLGIIIYFVTKKKAA